MTAITVHVGHNSGHQLVEFPGVISKNLSVPGVTSLGFISWATDLVFEQSAYLPSALRCSFQPTEKLGDVDLPAGEDVAAVDDLVLGADRHVQRRAKHGNGAATVVHHPEQLDTRLEVLAPLA